MTDNIIIRELTEEDLDEMTLALDLHAKIHGFKDHEDFAIQKHEAYEGMIKFGGGFTHALGKALARADSENSFKIYKAFKDTWNHHRELYLELRRNQDARQNETNTL